MSERLSITREIESNEEGKVVIKTTFRDQYSEEELFNIIPKQLQEMSKIRGDEAELRKYIEEKKYEQDFTGFKKSAEIHESFINTANDALKPYFERKTEEGKKKVEFLKTKERYDRIPHDASERRVEVKNRILAQVSQELNLKDVSHPVMMTLRNQCFEPTTENESQAAGQILEDQKEEQEKGETQ